MAKRESRWVNLIHEMLIRSKLDAAGNPQPYWPALWSYIEKNKERAARRERLHLLAREWKDRTGWARLFGLAGWPSLFGFRGLAAPGSLEHRYLRWSRGRAVVEAIVVVAIFGLVGESVYWAMVHRFPLEVLTERWAYLLGKDLPLPELVEIPAGLFMMGSNLNSREQPVHAVTFTQPFYLGRTEVTFREWDACVADGGCNGYRPADQGWGRGTQPVINVSWEDAQAYVGWLSRKTGKSCRLPSEAEWEYAARAGTTTEYALPSPHGSDDIQGLANCAECGSKWGNKQTAPVEQFPANAWGLHDMHGNVYQWVQDCFHKSYANAPEDERAWGEEADGDCSYRMLRGGSWFVSQVSARSAYRLRQLPDLRNYGIGIRVVCSSPSSGSVSPQSSPLLSPNSGKSVTPAQSVYEQDMLQTMELQKMQIELEQAAGLLQLPEEPSQYQPNCDLRFQWCRELYLMLGQMPPAQSDTTGQPVRNQD